MFDTSASSASQTTQRDVAAEVRDLRSKMRERDLPLTELGRLVGAAPSQLCNWERGRRGMTPKMQKRVREIVRARFAEHVAQVRAAATQHGIVVS
jgi:hypothetical protein